MNFAVLKMYAEDNQDSRGWGRYQKFLQAIISSIENLFKKIFDEVFDITKMRYPTWVISKQVISILELVCFCAWTLVQSESLSWQDF